MTSAADSRGAPNVTVSLSLKGCVRKSTLTPAWASLAAISISVATDDRSFNGIEIVRLITGVTSRIVPSAPRTCAGLTSIAPGLRVTVIPARQTGAANALSTVCTALEQYPISLSIKPMSAGSKPRSGGIL